MRIPWDRGWCHLRRHWVAVPAPVVGEPDVPNDEVPDDVVPDDVVPDDVVPDDGAAVPDVVAQAEQQAAESNRSCT